MTTETFVVSMSNEDIVVRINEVSFGQVKVTPGVIAQVKVMGGVPGPPGQSGGSGAGFNFVQSSPSATWTINHNLGFKPSIDLFTVGGMEILGEVVHTSVNQIIVNFNGAISGFARLT